MAALPRVAVIFTGGTIDSVGTDRLDLAWYNEAGMRLEQGELLARIPELAAIAQVEEVPFRRLPSHALTPRDLLDLNRTVHTLLESHDGVVITHGTNTLEETAYFLNLTVKHDRPVVVVGSMRPSTALSADGPLNLLNGIRTAVSPAARGKGVLVVLNDEINAARDVTKTNTYRVETFRAPELGLLGYVDGDQVAFYRESTKRHTSKSEFDVSGVSELPRVEILYSYAQPSTVALDALVASGVRGIVFAGTGAGLLSTIERNAIQKIASLPENARPILVRSARVGNGRVVANATYDAMNMIPADNLNPQKARVLLMVALTKTRDVKEITRMFREY